ncbi:MAG: site-specific DNA-methyltransferase [Candidatus Syntrophoarchaeum sp.]|nr:site-specific DNA-methyltransferase [Methanomicrobia archaeon]MBL7117769.1 site-specific DNA-methyltransferase [Candidatus Syntrophoarchaeum sp.]
MPSIGFEKTKFEQMINQIVEGDSFELLKYIPNGEIDLVITSPPYYKQRDYGGGIGNENTPEKYIENLLKIVHECVRIVKDTGSIVFNLGDKYNEEGSLSLIPFRFAAEVIKKEPVKLVNAITWIKTNPTPRQFKKRLVSSTEPFFHFVKSSNYYYNIDEFLTEPNTKKEKRRRENTNVGKKYFELIEKSTLSDQEKQKAREELQKVIEEVKKGEIAEFRMKIRGIHAPAFGGQEGGRKNQIEKQGFTIIRIFGNDLKRDVIESSVETIKNCPHPAIYPEYIIREMLKMLTREEDIVLDPFVGSGTTAVACKKLGRKYMGFDINPEYCEHARKRLGNTQALLTWF